MARILVLDDEPLVSMILEDFLTDLDFETVGPAHSIATALELIETTTIDGAILDISLGSVASYPVAEVLQAMSIPFALVTGRSADEVDERFKGAPMLSKPFNLKDLKTTMSQLFDLEIQS